MKLTYLTRLQDHIKDHIYLHNYTILDTILVLIWTVLCVLYFIGVAFTVVILTLLLFTSPPSEIPITQQNEVVCVE